MNIYKSGENRKQQLFFPPSIDEYVSEDNQVRAIEDYVELLDMVEFCSFPSVLGGNAYETTVRKPISTTK